MSGRSRWQDTAGAEGRTGPAGGAVWECTAGMTPGQFRKNRPGSGGRKPWKLLAGAALLCTALAMGKTESRAQEYTYTATFYPGNHGTFQGTEQVSVDNSGSGSSYEIEGDGDAIRVSGLRAGDIVSFDAASEGAVKLEEGSRYYVKGIRVSGRDNSTVDTSAFKVEGDRDYVVAYGIRGDLTSYTVNYQDENGNTLASSRTYYGNVGDKPVIAFRYIEGYQPQAYNLTKTLSKNTAENVFTFTYRRRPAASAGGNEGGGTDTPGTGTGTPGTGTGGGTGTPGAGTAGTPGAGTGTGTTPGAGAGTGTPGAGAGTGTGTTPGAGAGTGTPGTTVVTPGGQGAEQNPGGEQGGENPGGIQPGGTQNPENEGDSQNPGETDLQDPNEPQEVVDLDDENLPLAGLDEEPDSPFRFPMWGSICIAVAGAAAVGVGLWLLLARRKKEKAESDES